MKIENYVEI